MYIVSVTIIIAIIISLLILWACGLLAYSLFKWFGSTDDGMPFPDYRPINPKRKHCSLCNDGENSVSFISGLTILSPYSIYDLGRLDDVEYCPGCGRKLKKAESKIIPKSNT